VLLRCSGALRLDIDALAGAFLGGFDNSIEHLVGEFCEAFSAFRVALCLGENLVALDDIREAVVQQREDVGCDFLAQTVTGAEILIDPDLHVSWLP
jgi:hypothetical protein